MVAKVRQVLMGSMAKAHAKGQTLGDDGRLLWNSTLDEFPCERQDTPTRP